jgi:DNA-binding transcriptional LysR family regulator
MMPITVIAFSDSQMLDPVQLKTFLVIAEGHSFSEASRRLKLRQSTVSDHVRKLEKALGHQLFIRDTHSVAMTLEGEALVEFARNILETNERAKNYFTRTKLRGRVRFGASEDLVVSWLPEILHNFVDKHPLVDLEFTVALSGVLIDQFDAGELDVVFCKRRTGEERGDLVWRDELVWVDAGKALPTMPGQISLVIYPPPSITRAMALAALEQAGMPWRIACTSGSLNGLTAAVRAGLGIMAHARRLMPPGLREIATPLPPLGPLEFVLLRTRRAVRGPAAELCAMILAKADRDEITIG